MKLSAVQADAIQELGNIGAAHAATTLSQMLGSTIEMSVPAIRVVDLSQLGQYMGEESAAMVAFEPPGGYSPWRIYPVLHHPGVSSPHDEHDARINGDQPPPQ